MDLRLPQKANISVTSATDPTGYHYLPFIRMIMNQRLKMALMLMKGLRFQRLLDAGCGSGLLLPELSLRCQDLYATDIHPRMDRVNEMLRLEGIKAYLTSNSLTALDFADEYFDGVVALSVLEFIPDLNRALGEIYRVAKRRGTVILGFPAINIFTDISYRLIGINNAGELHKSNHQDILKEAGNRFVMEKISTFPSFLPVDLALFVCCRLRKE